MNSALKFRLQMEGEKYYRVLTATMLMVLHLGSSSAWKDDGIRCSVLTGSSRCDCFRHPDLEEGLHVRCVNSGIKEIPTNLTNPVVMELTHNSIWAIKDVNYPTLTQLRLGWNGIRYIEDNAFRGLRELTILILAHNHIMILTKDTFAGLRNLELLNLEYNHIFGITPEAFTGANMPRLQFLKLSKCHIHFIEPDSFQGLHNLFQLNLSSNHIKRLPVFGDESGLPNLSNLDLSSNHLQFISGASFRYLTSLSHLFLNRNHISQLLSNSFPVNVTLTLKSLWLRQNFISKVDPDALSQLKIISTLDVSFNLLEALDLTEIPESLEKVLVHDNPWNCSSCMNLWLMERQMVRDWNKDAHFTCASPESLRGINVYQSPAFSDWSVLGQATEMTATTFLSDIFGSNILTTAYGVWIGVGVLTVCTVVLSIVILYLNKRWKRNLPRSKVPKGHSRKKDESSENLIA